MIRLATRADLNLITDLVIEFLQATSYDNHLASGVDRTHIQKLVYAVLKMGRVWLAEYEHVAIGMLVAVKEQNIWMPDKVSLRELIFYVRPEHRRSMAAGRLFKAFCTEAENLLNNGEIDGYFTTRMASTDNYDLEKRGFREVERLFLRDREI